MAALDLRQVLDLPAALRVDDGLIGEGNGAFLCLALRGVFLVRAQPRWNVRNHLHFLDQDEERGTHGIETRAAHLVLYLVDFALHRAAAILHHVALLVDFFNRCDRVLDPLAQAFSNPPRPNAYSGLRQAKRLQ